MHVCAILFIMFTECYFREDYYCVLCFFDFFFFLKESVITTSFSSQELKAEYVQWINLDRNWLNLICHAISFSVHFKERV